MASGMHGLLIPACFVRLESKMWCALVDISLSIEMTACIMEKVVAAMA